MTRESQVVWIDDFRGFELRGASDHEITGIPDVF